MTDKTQIEIGLILPDVPDCRDQCVSRLTDLLAGRKGIQAAHVVQQSGGQSGQICVHFDRSQLSLGEVRHLAQQAGVELDRKYGHLLLKMEALYARKSSAIQARLQRMPGIVEAVVTPDGVVRIEFDREITDAQPIIDQVRRFSSVGAIELARVNADGNATVDAEPVGSEAPYEERTCQRHHGQLALFGSYTELAFSILCGVSLLAGWLISFSSQIPGIVPWGFYAASYLFGGFFTTWEAIQKILARRFEIDFLMLIAAIGAAILGHWAEGALLLFLFSLGHALEHYAMGRARRAIESLGQLAPESAQVRRGGVEQTLSVRDLVPGDVVIIKPNSRIPADGFVIRGHSSVDQSPITGESVPVEKRPVPRIEDAICAQQTLPPDHRVFAGTINGSGGVEVYVAKRAAESTLARMVTLVSEAETRNSPTQTFANKFEKIFVPAILALVLALLFAWLVIDEPFSRSFYRAMAVLVAASPCALAISTPSAVLSGIARAASGGVLVKGGAPLENLGRVEAVAFDKTGTLTEGELRVTDVVSVDGVTDEELLRTAVAVEIHSDHPLAIALVRDGSEILANRTADRLPPPGGFANSTALTELTIPEATDARSITGHGISAKIDDAQVMIGNNRLFASEDGDPIPVKLRESVEKLEMAGRTTMLIRRGQQFLGAIGLMDTPRESASDVIRQLRTIGIRQMIMISGDNQAVADAVAKQIGIDRALGGLLPEDKVSAVKQIRERQDIAMVGDGVNDAPAMAAASVGIAMGAAGSDVALETADVALMADNLHSLPFAIGLSRQTSRIIRQNLFFSLGMVLILVPATISGLGIGLAVLFHEGSTVAVVANALRLLAYKLPPQNVVATDP